MYTDVCICTYICIHISIYLYIYIYIYICISMRVFLPLCEYYLFSEFHCNNRYDDDDVYLE